MKGMNKEFRNALGGFCVFNDDGIILHSDIGKQSIHLFIPYGCVDSIKFSLGSLSLTCQGKFYSFPVNGGDKSTMKECIAFAQQSMLNATPTNVIEIDPLEKNSNTPTGYVNNPPIKIEKSVESIKAYFGGMETKSYKQAVAALPNMVASMADDEEILYAFDGFILQKNGDRESVVDVVNILTNKRYYFAGADGKAVFLAQPKSGAVELKDVHAITVGTEGLRRAYVSFETKNEDYKLLFGNGIDGAPFKAKFDDAISQAQKSTVETTKSQSAFSVADELKKFKELLDMDIITQEEFDAKKKQLLGL